LGRQEAAFDAPHINRSTVLDLLVRRRDF